MKKVFSDVIFIYKKIFFWLKIKLFAFVFGIFTGIILGLPFLILGATWSYYNGIEHFFKNQFGSSMLANICLVLFYFVFVNGFLYAYQFLLKFYLKFLNERKKFSFALFKNFFNLKDFFKFSLLNTFFLFFGLIILIILLSLAFLVKDILGFEVAYTLASSFAILGILGIIFLSILYLIYRFAFSYAILLDEKVGVFESLKLSFKKTKKTKKFIKILVIIFVFLTLYLPFYSIERTNQKEINKILDYAKLHNLEVNIKNGTITDENELQTAQNKLEKNKDYYETLQYKYNNHLADGSLNSIYFGQKIIYYFIIILYFFLFFGLPSFIYTSIYINFIKK